MHSGFAIYKAGKRTFKEAWFRAILIFFIIFVIYALIMTSEIFIRKGFFKGLLFKFILMLITLTIFAISMLPCTLWLYIYMFNIINIPPAMTLLLAGLCFLGGIALFLYCRTLFALSQYIFVIRPDIGIFRILRGSIKLMKGKRIVYLSLILRCIPAALSCIFLLPSIYSVPIINSAIAEFAFDICGTGKTLKI